MSSGKPSGLKPPGTKMGKSSGIPHPRTSIPVPGGSRSQSALAESARNAGLSASNAELYAKNLIAQIPENSASLNDSIVSQSHLTGPEPLPPVKPTDDFIIGDRIWVKGTKPGHIAFIGETQFAPGDWVGIVLDDPVGKNDGSVAGVRYFQCEMKRGVFARISNISRTPETKPTARSTPSDVSSVSSATAPPRQSLSSSNGVTPPHSANSTTKTPKFTIGKSPAVSNTSINKVGSGIQKPSIGLTKPNASSLPHAGVNTSLKIGDRVMVNGTKAGSLRFLGTTDFSKGVWCGVELDDALGKNDGSVAGKRYFTCTPLYGLFAPIHKVTRISVTTPPITPLSKRSIPVSGLRMSRRHSGSQDSISSISSTASSVSRSRIKPTRQSMPSTTATTTALQKALKEKDDHIEQLLQERELERSEVARAAVHVDKAESELVKSKTEFERTKEDYDEMVKTLEDQLAEKQSELVVLQGKLDEETRKVEDLQFEMAEDRCKDDTETDKESSSKNEPLLSELKTANETIAALQSQVDALQTKQSESEQLQTTLDSSNQQIRDLTSKLESAETNQSATQQLQATLESSSQQLHATITSSNQQIQDLTSKLESAETKLSATQQQQATLESSSQQLQATITSSNQQISDLTSKLESAENKLHDYESQATQQSNRNSQVVDELGTKIARVSELETSITDKSRQIRVVEENLAEMTESLSLEESKVLKLQTTVDTLSNQLRDKDLSTQSLQSEIHELKSQLTELKHLLETSNNKSTQLTEDNIRQERQLKEMLDTSGNTSQQVALLSERLTQRDRELEETRNALSNSTRGANKSNSELSELRSQHLHDLDSLTLQHNNDIQELERQKDTVQSEVDKMKHKLERLTHQHKTDLDELSVKKDSQIADINNRLGEQENLVFSLTEQIEQKSNQTEQLSNDLNLIQKKNVDIQKTFDEIMTLNQELNDIITQLKDQLITNEMVNATLRTEQEALQQNIVTINEQNQRERDQSTSQHRETLDTLRRQHTQTMNETEMKVDTISEQLRVMSHETATVTEQRDTLTQTCESLMQQCDNLKQQCGTLTQQYDTLTQQCATVEKQRDALNQQCNTLTQECDTIAQQHDALNQQCDTLSQKSDTMLQELETTSEELHKKSHDIDSLNIELDKVRKENISQRAELNSHAEKEDAMQKSMEMSVSQIKLVETERDGVNEQLQDSQIKFDELEFRYTELEAQLEDFQQQRNRETQSQQEVRHALESAVNTAKTAIVEHEQTIDKQAHRISNLENDNNHLHGYKVACQKLENEQFELYEKIAKLEDAEMATDGNMSGDSAVASMKQEKEEAEQQIEFLNTIIADLQKKYEKAKVKIHNLTTDMVNGADSPQDMDNMDGPLHTGPAPRLFCDICDVFDQHETEDCPQQAMTDSPPASHFAGSRDQERPYCDTCEMFGHWTDECDDEETF